MGMFGAEDTQSSFARAVKLVEAAIRGFGLDSEKNRIQTNDGSTAWALMRGSAEVLVFLNPGREAVQESYLRVIAPVWRLPEENREAIFRRLLELNARELYGTAFALMNDDAVLVTERTLRDLDQSEVEEILSNIGTTADFFDDKLVQEFGGRRISDLKHHH